MNNFSIRLINLIVKYNSRITLCYQSSLNNFVRSQNFISDDTIRLKTSELNKSKSLRKSKDFINGVQTSL